MRPLILFAAWAAAAFAQHAANPPGGAKSADPSASVKNPYATDSAAIDAGRGSFRIYCAPCHGIKGTGGRAPDLTTADVVINGSDDALREVIGSGRPGTEMGGYAGLMGTDNLWRVVAYVRSIGAKSAPPAAGNPETGSTLYWGKAACGSCHMVAGKGGRMGPELTTIGKQRSVEFLRQSLFEPDEWIANGYNTIVVTARDGRKTTGIQLSFDNFSAVIMDSSERILSFDRAAVASIERETRSLMPSYKGKLTAAETDHLLAYLATLGRGGK